jgi:hypothetical protein
MPSVIAAPWMDVLDQACVCVCPVARMHCDVEKDSKLYIDWNAYINHGRLRRRG